MVCPQCGTPYHRACYEAGGGCKFADRHGDGYRYTPPKEESSHKDGMITCHVCGEPIPGSSLFCPKCGAPTNAQVFRGGAVGGAHIYGGTASQPIDLGRELTDGVTAEEAAAFVKIGQPYYIPKFIHFSSGKTKVSFSFSAFLFPSIYYFYRKMWGIGTLSFLAYLGLNLPLFANVVASYITELQLGTVPAFLQTLANPSGLTQGVLSGILMVFCVLSALFANYLYYRKVVKEVKKEKANTVSPMPVVMRLQAKGGVSIGVVFAVLFGSSFLISLSALIISQFL